MFLSGSVRPPSPVSRSHVGLTRPSFALSHLSLIVCTAPPPRQSVMRWFLSVSFFFCMLITVAAGIGDL